MSGHRQQAAAPAHGETDRCGHRDLGYSEGASNESSRILKLYNHEEGFMTPYALCNVVSHDIGDNDPISHLLTVVNVCLAYSMP